MKLPWYVALLALLIGFALGYLLAPAKPPGMWPNTPCPTAEEHLSGDDLFYIAKLAAATAPPQLNVLVAVTRVANLPHDPQKVAEWGRKVHQARLLADAGNWVGCIGELNGCS